MSVSIEEHERIIKELQHQLEKSKVKTEQYFQRLLEDRYNAKHQKTKLGITDLTNDAFHGEIKEWEKIHHGLGQLLVYNAALPRSKMILFCFGIKPTQSKLEIIVQLCKSYDIQLIHLDQDGNEEILVDDDPINGDLETFVDKYICKGHPTDKLTFNEIMIKLQTYDSSINAKSTIQQNHLKNTMLSKGFGNMRRTRINGIHANNWAGVKWCSQ